MMKKAIFGITCAVLMLISCNPCYDDDRAEGEIYVDQIESAEGNVVITESGMKVYLLGIKDGDAVGKTFLEKYVGETIHVIADSKLEQDPVGVDSIWGYAVFEDGRCLNHLLLLQEPQLFTPINVEDSLDNFRPPKDNNQEISDMGLYLKQRVFMIEVPEGGGLSNFGTGFFINDEGVAVTNHHVFDGSNDAFCYPFNSALTQDYEIDVNQRYNASTNNIIISDSILDITIFKVQLPQGVRSNFLSLAKKHIGQGEKLYTIGNPVSVNEVLVGTLTDGLVSGYRELNSKKPLVQYTLSTNCGNSGGPVCDKRGKVVAVHCAGDKALQNVNYGIDILAVRNLLKNCGLYYGGK